MPTSTAGKRRNPNNMKRERGFTYAVVLVAVVLIGIFAGVANIATSRIVQAEREKELLFRGMAYRSAIQRYYAVTGRYPHVLSDLLKDPRFAQQAYLRALYPDPMADREQAGSKSKEDGGWQLLRAADGGIAGVASRSKMEPMKKTNFPLGFEKFDEAKSYTEWIFDYSPLPVSVAKNAKGSASVGASSR